MQPVCEFTAPDTRNNLQAAIFHDSNPCKADIEDAPHRWCVLLHLKLRDQSKVAIVKNLNTRHHRMKPDLLQKEYRAQQYLPAPEEEAGRAKTLDNHVAQVDFTLVKSILLMVNQARNKLDKIKFRDENEKYLASLTLKKPIVWEVSKENPMVLDHYLRIGLFTGGLDFLAKFFGHQGVSAKWLCLWCLANQDFLGETVRR